MGFSPGSRSSRHTILSTSSGGLMTLVLSAFFTALVTKSRSVKRKQYTSIWGKQGQERPEVRARVLGPQTGTLSLSAATPSGGTQTLSNTSPAPTVMNLKAKFKQRKGTFFHQAVHL